MKILIIENEYSFIDTPFEYLNDLYFNNSIEYTVIPKSQDLRHFNSIVNFDYVFLDISLAKKSELDGFGILRRIKDDNLDVKNIVILTGNHYIKEKLIEKGLPSDYPILTKPIDFEDLLKIIRRV
ncbi:response regulator receiver domain-containing protein [Breznakibacter xylanolyticus]|uniref:Response regulator receiver domain-containing protein n=1 Tax=Breznakibacter xylanolyticus TaxID=990 RepID=A0A2W7N206_9BACT|nr:response regulator [Breznakibacter xylanolyticus]PZX10894.1 response regulator receiver domain-containing protein [Breznakibacter xylanolyticus]